MNCIKLNVIKTLMLFTIMVTSVFSYAQTVDELGCCVRDNTSGYQIDFDPALFGGTWETFTITQDGTEVFTTTDMTDPYSYIFAGAGEFVFTWTANGVTSVCPFFACLVEDPTDASSCCVAVGGSLETLQVKPPNGEPTVVACETDLDHCVPCQDCNEVPALVYTYEDGVICITDGVGSVTNDGGATPIPLVNGCASIEAFIETVDGVETLKIDYYPKPLGATCEQCVFCLDVGNPPTTPQTCEEAATSELTICEILAADPTNPLADLDCDGGGVINAIDCSTGNDPTDGGDDCVAGSAYDGGLCGYLTDYPTSSIATVDCDNGGVDNATECDNGTNPNDNPEDDIPCVEGDVVDNTDCKDGQYTQIITSTELSESGECLDASVTNILACDPNPCPFTCIQVLGGGFNVGRNDSDGNTIINEFTGDFVFPAKAPNPTVAWTLSGNICGVECENLGTTTPSEVANNQAVQALGAEMAALFGGTYSINDFGLFNFWGAHFNMYFSCTECEGANIVMTSSNGSIIDVPFQSGTIDVCNSSETLPELTDFDFCTADPCADVTCEGTTTCVEGVCECIYTEAELSDPNNYTCEGEGENSTPTFNPPSGAPSIPLTVTLSEAGVKTAVIGSKSVREGGGKREGANAQRLAECGENQINVQCGDTDGTLIDVCVDDPCTTPVKLTFTDPDENPIDFNDPNFDWENWTVDVSIFGGSSTASFSDINDFLTWVNANDPNGGTWSIEGGEIVCNTCPDNIVIPTAENETTGIDFTPPLFYGCSISEFGGGLDGSAPTIVDCPGASTITYIFSSGGTITVPNGQVFIFAGNITECLSLCSGTGAERMSCYLNIAVSNGLATGTGDTSGTPTQYICN